MDKQEIWKPIEGYEGLYEVSNFGRVRSLDRYVRNNDAYNRKICGKIMKPHMNENGYMIVSLRNGGERHKKYRVHRLVALAFLPNPNNYTDVNHKDEVKHHNNLDNLEWCNRSYNSLYGTAQERLSKHKYHPVEMRDVNNGRIIRKFESIKQASQDMNIKRSHISRVCRGERKTAGGYIWRYAD